MAFKTKGIVIINDDGMDDRLQGTVPFKSIDEIPGIEKITRRAELEWIEQRLDDPRIIMQFMDTRIMSKLATTDTGEALAGYGYKCIDKLGEGKDGKTYFCHRYIDNSNNKYIVKFWSPYAKQWLQNAKYLQYRLSQVDKSLIPKTLVNFVAKGDFIVYEADNPYVSSSEDPQVIKNHIANLCSLNSFMLQYLELMFWDFGFGNGKNYMTDVKGRLKWVDYGGAGILRHPSLKDNKKFMKEYLPAINAGPKGNLGWANNIFIQLQFLFHMQFHLDQTHEYNKSISVYSSMIQLDRLVMENTYEHVLESLLTVDLCKRVYKEFKNKDWTDYTTWKQLSKFLHVS